MSTVSRLVSAARSWLVAFVGVIAWAFGGSGMPAARIVRLGVLAFIGTAVLVTGSSVAPALADSCPNAQLRYGYGASLPDCRAYEQVTPTDKNGTNPQVANDAVQAALNGDGMTFASKGTFPGGVGAQTFAGEFLSSRGADGWSTQGLLPPASLGNGANVLGWTPDLSEVFDDVSDSVSDSSSLLLRRSSDGGLETVATGSSIDAFAGASSDGSKVFFEDSGAQLTPDAVPGQDNLYGWDRDTGNLSLVGVLPDSACGSPPCVPAGGSFAGPYDWFSGTGDTSQGGAMAGYYTQDEHAISSDGSKAYFTAGGTGQIYLRENPTSASASTVPVSASQKTNGSGSGGTDPDGPQPAAFMGATPDGSQTFFTSREELTNDANTGADTIGRANLDGTGADQSFLEAVGAKGFAVDGSYIYWAEPKQDAIGRANLDGSDPNPDFITGASNPQYVAVDSNYVYWTNAADGVNGDGTIGRANLDGTGVNESFITGASNPQGIAVDSSYIYWANQGSTLATRRIARANLDGTGANQSFISVSGAGNPGGIAVDANYIYYTEPASNYIGRASLAGTGNNANFLFTGSSTTPQGIAVDANYIYWASSGSDAIGRANLDGTSPNDSFVTDACDPQGVAVDASNVYWSNPAGDTGNDLYRYDATSSQLTDLTPDASDPSGADVLGVLGISDDGSYVYFVANGDLDGSGPATTGNCQGTVAAVGKSLSGMCSLYVWHDGAITFVTQLDANSDFTNWMPLPNMGLTNNEKTSRVSADGTVLLFSSQLQLTSYDNNGGSCVVAVAYQFGPGQCAELYRYDALSGAVSCVSCDPSGASPTGSAALQTWNTSITGTSSFASILTRNLSADGDRIFFESPDPLVASDTNGSVSCPTVRGGASGIPILACLDVYEWEADGSGSCQSTAQNGGCLYLLSTGKSPDPSFFGDASATGDDAFIFTDQPLVGQDQDQLVDVYDARVDGGMASQDPPPSTPCSSADACKGPTSAPSPASVAATVTFSGPGNPKAGSSSVRPKVLTRAVRGATFLVKVKVPAAGWVTISGAGIKRVARRAARAGTYALRIRLTTKDKKLLARKRKLKLRLRVGYEPPAGGPAAIVTASFTLKPALRRGKRASSTRRATSATRRASR